jgi:predicted dehydrogenase
MTSPKPELNVAMVGYGFMGAAHSQGWRSAPRFFDLPIQPRMKTIVGRDAAKVEAAREQFGWEESETDWTKLIERDDIHLIDVCTPGDTHADIAIAALQAGKHVVCEKPLANTVEEAERMATAAEEAARNGVYAMVGFSYRRVPALIFARQLIRDGRIGDVRQVRAAYLQDWLSDAEGPMTWRLDKSKAGSGSLGDIGAHAVDAIQFLTGQTVDSVSGVLETLVKERPLLGEQVGLGGTASDERGQVTVDDVALFLGRLSGGALGTFEATRYALGRKNALKLEVNGSKGSLAFDLERMNELEFYDGTDAAGEQGFRRILVTEPEHPFVAKWWPTGHGLGWEHSFTHQVVDFMNGVHSGEQPEPSFAEGAQVQRVLGAVEQSSEAGGTWIQTNER